MLTFAVLDNIKEWILSITTEELSNPLKKIIEVEGTEEEIDNMLDILQQNVPDPNIADYIYYDELSPEEIIDKALTYKPIQL